jgi:hypothetical protein
MAARTHLPINQGCFETHFQVSPNSLVIDTTANTIAPWQAYNGRLGFDTINHAVVMDMTLMDPELFFLSFKDTYRVDRHKAFQKALPKWSTNMDFYDWYESLVRIGQMFGFLLLPSIHYVLTFPSVSGSLTNVSKIGSVATRVPSLHSLLPNLKDLVLTRILVLLPV